MTGIRIRIRQRLTERYIIKMITNRSCFCITASTFVIGCFACHKEKTGQILIFADIIVPGVTIPLYIIIRNCCYGCSRIFPGVAPYICYDILYGTLSIHMVLFCQFCRHDQHIHRICLTTVIGCCSTPPMIQLPVQLRPRCGQYILIQRTWFVCIQFCKLCFTGCCLYVMPIQGLPCMCLSCIFVILICGSTDIFDLRIRGSSFPYQPRGSIEIIRLITGASCRSRCLKISVFQLVVVADLKCRRFRQKLTGSILSLNLIVTAGTFIQRHIQCGSIFRYIIGISGYFMALHPCPGIAPFRMFVPFQCDTIRYITGQLCCQCAGILDVIRNCDRNSTCSILCIFFFI